MDKLQELSRLQQTTTIAVYLEQFEELLNGVSGQSELALISFFIRGLKPELKGELKIREPETLRKAFSLQKFSRNIGDYRILEGHHPGQLRRIP